MGTLWQLAIKAIRIWRHEGFRVLLGKTLWKLKQSRLAVALKRGVRRPEFTPGEGSPSSSHTAGVTSVQVGISLDGIVNIMAPQFFDLEGNTMFLGGAERYAIELAHLIQGYYGAPVCFYQAGKGEWIRSCAGFVVRSIDTGGSVESFNERYHALVRPVGLTIYLSFYYAYPHCHPNSVGISHGVFWDHPSFQGANGTLSGVVANVLGAIRNLEQVVSVDTNTINWVRATCAGNAPKMRHIPNFVDYALFSAGSHARSEGGTCNEGRIVVTYPRRLYAPRGFWAMVEIVPELLDRHPGLEFHLVGQADPREAEAAKDLVNSFPDRVKWYQLPIERMPEAYAASDIAVIPTLYAEGTSLSCLEAMAAGNAVVATNVGGLPELIQDRFTGLLVEPSTKAIREAIETLVVDSTLRGQLQERAREAAKSFDIAVWRHKWLEVLARHLGPVRARTENSLRGLRHTGPTVVYPLTPAVSWWRMKQRPHHLCEGFAKRGLHTFFTTDQPVVQKGFSRGYLHVVTPVERIDAESPLLYIHYPYNFERIKDFKDPFVIYDMLDSVDIYRQSDKIQGVPDDRNALSYHQKMLSRADLVIAGSRTVMNEALERRDKVLLVPNGVNVDDFRGVPPEKAALLPAKGRPVVGFHGCMAPWLDFDMLAKVTRDRWDLFFVFVGPVNFYCHERFNRLLGNSNVLHVDEQPYETLPKFVAAFDVGIIPFILDDVTRAASPIKIYEYAAARKPIVGAALPACLEHEQVVVSSPDPSDFSRALDKALSLRQSPAYLASLDRLADENTWGARADLVLCEIQRRLRQSAVRDDLIAGR